ncbi:MAG: cytochrome c1 [Alphaproteobacteria bacterium]|nr:cytochrome c1 [Alphaproteobacteria bacterium]
MLKATRTLAILLAAGLGLAAGAAQGAGEAKHPHAPPGGWSFEGMFGHYDKAAVQRGFQIYKEVCAACHGMEYVAIRTLGSPSGPGYSEDEVEAVAAEFRVPAGPDPQTGSLVDDIGLPRLRPALPSDRFTSPYPNDIAARAANGGALPPDLSVIAKAREGGASYIYSLMTGYQEPPPGVTLEAGMHYNPYMAGGQIAMPPQLVPDRVAYEDGTEASVEQMASDIATFLNWAAEPELEFRKKLGFMVISYLAVLSLLVFLAYRRLWRNVGH